MAKIKINNLKINEYKTGAILQYVYLFISNIIGLLYVPFLIRYLGPSEYGLYNLLGSIAGYFILFDLGLGVTITRFVSRCRTQGEYDKQSRLLGVLSILYCGVGILIVSVGLFLYFNFDTVFGNSLTDKEIERGKIMLLILLINIFISFVSQIFTATITAYEKFIFPKILLIVYVILQASIIIPILILGYKGISVIIVKTILSTIVVLLNGWYCIKILKIKIKFNLDFTILKEVFSYSFFVFLAAIADILYWKTDQTILGITIGTSEVSIYAVAGLLVGYFMNLTSVLSSIFAPRIYKIEETVKSLVMYEEIFFRVGRLQYIIISLILSGFILFGKEFIAIWAGKGYETVYYLVLIIMIPSVIPRVQHIGITILQAKNLHSYRSIIYLLMAVGNVVISIPLAKNYGAIGCALGTAISLILGDIIALNWVYIKKVKINIFKQYVNLLKIFPVTFITLILGFTINNIFPISSIITLFINVTIFVLLFLLINWIFIFNRNERELFQSMTIKIFKQLRIKYP
jgi:O-antigen/teichoic acid export membrane protein